MSGVSATPKLPSPSQKMLPASTCGVTLNTGYLCPSLGLGTWGGGESEEKVADAVTEALKIGYRMFDCAECYGNEKALGKAFKNYFDDDENSVQRSDICIVSKVWNTNHKAEHVREACLNTLKNLQTDYLDAYLIHWPIAFEYTGPGPCGNDGTPESIPKDSLGHCRLNRNTSIYETWKAMESLVDDGLVRSIGVSNFSSIQLADILSYAKYPPAINQVECHAYLIQENLLKMCRSKGITMVAYAPLGRPGSVRYNKLGPVLLEEPVVLEIAKKKETTVPCVLLRWNMQRGIVVIPKSTNPDRLLENFSSMCDPSIELGDDEMELMSSLNKPLRYCNYPWGVGGAKIFD